MRPTLCATIALLSLVECNRSSPNVTPVNAAPQASATATATAVVAKAADAPAAVLPLYVVAKSPPINIGNMSLAMVIGFVADRVGRKLLVSGGPNGFAAEVGGATHQLVELEPETQEASAFACSPDARETFTVLRETPEAAPAPDYAEIGKVKPSRDVRYEEVVWHKTRLFGVRDWLHDGRLGTRFKSLALEVARALQVARVKQLCRFNPTVVRTFSREADGRMTLAAPTPPPAL